MSTLSIRKKRLFSSENHQKRTSPSTIYSSVLNLFHLIQSFTFSQTWSSKVSQSLGKKAFASSAYSSRRLGVVDFSRLRAATHPYHLGPVSLIWQQQQQQQRRLLWVETLALLLFEHRVELVREVRQHIADVAQHVDRLAARHRRRRRRRR